jgi:hypothetical protein
MIMTFGEKIFYIFEFVFLGRFIHESLQIYLVFIAELAFQIKL